MSEELEGLVKALGDALSRDFGGPPLPSPEGYQYVGVRLRTFRRVVPVIELAKEGQTLSFIVTPTNLAEPAYRRSARLDLTYFSEDVPDNEQSKIYARDKTVIDRMAAWVASWDKRNAP